MKEKIILSVRPAFSTPEGNTAPKLAMECTIEGRIFAPADKTMDEVVDLFGSAIELLGWHFTGSFTSVHAKSEKPIRWPHGDEWL